MADYKASQIKKLSQIVDDFSPIDSDYWKKLEHPVIIKEFGAITDIDFSQVEPYHFSVTSSCQVHIYNSITNQILKKLSRFHGTAYGGSFRKDGKLLVAGDVEGQVRIFDVATKNILRILKGHERPVHVCKFVSDNIHVATFADDKSIKLWDIPCEKEVMTYTEHEDYIRAGAVSQSSKDLLLSGCYDHKAKFFDSRLPASVITVDHGNPVEAVAMFPTGSLFITAGGNLVKIWDILAGGKLLNVLTHHHKTVTCLAFASNYSRLLTGSLDRHIKVYDVISYKVIQTLDYTSPILSCGISNDDKVLAVGMQDGTLSIQHRKADISLQEKNEEKIRKTRQKMRFMAPGKNLIPQKDDVEIRFLMPNKLSQFDKYLKSFQFTKALDCVLTNWHTAKNPSVTVTVMQQLIRRGAIKNALAGRNIKELRPLFKFFFRNLTIPEHMPVLTDVALIFLDIYAPQVYKMPGILPSIERLKDIVDKEIKNIKSLSEIIGSLDMILSASHLPSLTDG